MLILFILLPLFILTSSLQNPNITNATYEVQYIGEIDNVREHIFVFEKHQGQHTAQVFVISNNSTIDNPLMVVVRQHKEILSWQLPVMISSDSDKAEFHNSAKTLCPDNITNYQNYYDENFEYEDGPIVTVSTESKYKLDYTLIANLTNIFVEEGVDYNIMVTPSKPHYYFYNFPKNSTEDNDSFKTVLLKVNSNDDVCMLVSIQNASCPVYDQLHTIKFEGYWETVDKQGGFTISKQKFPHGFFVVFVAQSEDSDCVGYTEIQTVNRNKNVTFVIKPSISYKDYVKAVGITVGCIMVSYVVLISTFCLWAVKDTKPRDMNYIDENDSHLITTPSSIQAPELRDDCSMDETEYDTVTEVEYDRELILTKPVLYLSDLARKDPRVLKKKSYFYLWHVLTVALFYGLPVVQLVITYQNVLNNTGNQDLCYYNFLCARPLGFLSDFNHLFSNIGYVTFGILFILLVYKRERLHKDDTFEKHFGIPQHYGLYYAIGASLIMEGILSGSYHICPNHSNFQFDSSFMYVIAVLCIVKLYQTRHPDINATAYTTFAVLAVAILLGMIGVLEANLIFWISFTVLHLSLCLVMTVQVYYFGYWKLDKGVLLRVWQVYKYAFWTNPRSMFRPLYKGRMVLAVLGNVCNWILAILGIYNHERDFATYLLAVFMCNTMLYFIFYIIMKLLHKEKIKLQPLMYLVLSITCAVPAIYFFYHKSISWALTPAQSRRFNQECKLLRFYDYHDIWHFLSAIGMFFSFMMLLTLDDDLSHSLRTKIAVF